MRVGILTAGGDCPGLNAAIRAAARKLLDDGHEPVGLLRGFRGLCDPALRMPLTRSALTGIVQLGGTILQTSSFDPYRDDGGIDRVRTAQQAAPLDAVIAIGGDHTMQIARRLSDDGVAVVGMPKTIDNDVAGTDRTFGADTAVQVATDAIDRLRTTAQSHDRAMVVEVMGRDSGSIAAEAGLASGADLILVPEIESPLDAVVASVAARHVGGKRFSIIVVAEGARLMRSEASGGGPAFLSDRRDEHGFVRFGGVGAALADAIEVRTGIETRATVLGHVQRGGTPVASDRILATRLGLHAAELVASDQTGRMAALRGREITSVPLADTDGLRPVDPAILAAAAIFFS
ncbi:MAG: ATP-dependent 6-phosphofructokinase [Solirubrobacteraceae bacterium]|nr:ATP-dependent 6-phosphofructokinase [Solirubrobacteraceae bacterium]